jgi:hypothetical protein
VERYFHQSLAVSAVPVYQHRNIHKSLLPRAVVTLNAFHRNPEIGILESEVVNDKPGGFKMGARRLVSALTV